MPGRPENGLRRVYSMPERGDASPSKDLRSTKSEDVYYINPDHKLDRYGFILNIDSHGNIRENLDDEDGDNNAANNKTSPPVDATTTERRKKKWKNMMTSDVTKTLQNAKGRRFRLILRRARKGIPDSQRGKIWPLLCNVPQKINDNPGLYADLVNRSIIRPNSATSATKNGQASLTHTKSFRSIQETIERDIHRTFPRHSMFYDDDNGSDENDKNNDNYGNNLLNVSSDCSNGEGDIGNGDDESEIAQSALQKGLCGTTEISSMIRDLEITKNYENKKEKPQPPKQPPKITIPPPEENDDFLRPETVLEGKGGQAAMRRVLKAYSMYDRKTGYCQGMNFITGMFLTLMTEEEAFWMLVVIMFEKPCKMRGLFGEGMRETHKVLYVAEKLIHQMLPRLAKHLDKETIHVTMYATQWLLTQFTSSFRFDLVTRVWDCFLVEGWKITYRVMLSLLKHCEAELMNLRFEEILNLFRGLPEKANGPLIVDEAMKIPLRWVHIRKYEKEWDEQNPNDS